MMLISTFTICTFVSVVYGQSYTNMTGLKTTLLTSYDAAVVPLLDQTDTLSVNVTLYLLSIQAIDQVKGAITYGIQLKCEWFDELMQWTPGAHNGITEVYMSSDDVWTPPIAIGNPVSFTNLETSWMQVHYSSDGHATLAPISILESTCSFYMKYWPFDMQQCDLTLFPFAYSDQTVTLSVTSDGVDTSLYNKNPEWNLLTDMITHEIDTSLGNSAVNFKFKLARQPSFYLLTVIMPINGIGMLTCLVFLLPSESGERIGYAITIMLALAVFLTVTAADLPKTSEPIPILCIYILFGMMICFGAVVLVTLNLVLYYREEKVPISDWYKRLVRLSQFRRCKRSSKNKGDDQSIGGVVTNGNGRRNSRITPVLPEKKQVSAHGTVDEEINDADENEEITWQVVSKAIDKLLFYILVFMTYIPSIVILIVLAVSSDFGPE